MEKQIILIIRRSKDYWLYNKVNSDKLNPHVQPIIKLWDSFFNLKIMDFRNQLREIASSTYLNNKFDQIFLHSYIDPDRTKEQNNLKNELYEESIIVPMDEDDWIDSSLAEILKDIGTDKKFFIWNYYKTIREYKFEPFKNGRERGWTIPCSWSIRGYASFLKRHNHLRINEEEFSDIYFIKKPLAMKVEHIASVGFLKKVVRKNWKKENKWMNVIVNKIKGDLTVKGNEYPEVFQIQFKKYKNLLKELLESKKKNVQTRKNNKAY